MRLAQRSVAEAVGTAMLLATVIGSGIMGERLAGGNVAIALLANTIATGAALVALILTFASISGAHLNPAVTLAEAFQGGIAWRDARAYITAQFFGAFAGVVIAHLMFGEAIFSISRHVRAGGAQAFSEFIATFGLLSVIMGVSRYKPNAVAFAVGAYITAAYWFTASTSFANPAVTLARTVSDTFAGIRPADAPRFIVAQLIGAAAATALFSWLPVPSSEKLPSSDGAISSSNEQQIKGAIHMNEPERSLNNPARILILCTGNSARSQMAEGILCNDGGENFVVSSAGSKPSSVRPEAIQVMNEIGIDISDHRSKSVDEFVGQEFDYVITVCDNARETCPVFPGNTRRIHQSFEDPPPQGEKNAEETLYIFRRVRDEIREWMRGFIATAVK